MNTANLQLEGLYSALAALTNALRDKGVLSAAEIDSCLATAEDIAVQDPLRPRELSQSNLEAIRFPFRYLREANRGEPGSPPRSFAEIATEVGMSKDEKVVG